MLISVYYSNPVCQLSQVESSANYGYLTDYYYNAGNLYKQRLSVILLRFPLLFTHHYPARCFGMNMPKSRDIQAKIPLPQAIWNEFWLRYCEQ